MAVCASGYDHSLFIDPLGCVWGCGSNQMGQLGMESSLPILSPQKIKNLPPIISVSAGAMFSLFLDQNYSVWSCGRDGVIGNTMFPEIIKNIPKISSVIALCLSSLFLDFEGSVWSCGCNQNGQLGLGDIRDRRQPERVAGLPKIKAIAGGYDHSLFLDFEGSVWACGHNREGNLGLGDTTNRTKPEKIPGLPKIKSMAGGGHWSMFVDEQGSVWVCGWNKRGGLGLGHTKQINSPQKNDSLSGIVAIGGGNAHYTVFLDNAGNIFTCGGNQYGQLGLGDTQDRHTPQRVENIPPIASLSSCNTALGYVQLVDWEGRVWGCGKNDGQLGLSHTNETLTFRTNNMIVKQNHKLARTSTNYQAEPEVEEKEIFKALEREQNKLLMWKLKSNIHLQNINKQQAKQKIIAGVIDMADWPSKWGGNSCKEPTIVSVQGATQGQSQQQTTTIGQTHRRSETNQTRTRQHRRTERGR